MPNQIIIGKQFPQKIIPFIDQAKKSIDIVVYDWRWYENDPGCAVQLFNQAIVRAVRRGVKVRAVVNNQTIKSTLGLVGVSAKTVSLSGIMHAKLMIIDDSIAVTGSHNYTQSAFTLNQELSVAIIDCQEIETFNTFFNSLW